MLRLLATCFILLLGLPSIGQADSLFASSRIEDRAGVLSEDEVDQLVDHLDAIRDETGFVILFLIEKDFRNDPANKELGFFDYGDRIYQSWRQENPDQEKAIIFVLDLKERMLSYEVSPQIKEQWGDEIKNAMSDSFVAPIKRGDYAQALMDGSSMIRTRVLDPYNGSDPKSVLTEDLDTGLDATIPLFAINVVAHVLYHEAGHALIREFDLPVLANEEVMADSFATVWITQQQTDRAAQIVSDRVRSWLYEDSEVNPANYDFKGEHELDIRRAYQVACLFYGADPAKWTLDIAWLGFSESDLSDCSDTAPDQIEGWSAVLASHMRPDGDPSEKVEVIYGEGPLAEAMQATGILEIVATDLRRFDWPEPITLHFDHCDRGASWSRSERRILLCDDYVSRFIKQAETLSALPPK